MTVELVAISSLIPDPANARKHSEKNLAAIKGSLAKFGQQKPIVVGRDNVVVAGNGTFVAAKALGWDTLSIVRTELTGAQATAFGIADNRTGELAEWDLDNLGPLLRSLDDMDFDLSAIGFDAKDLAKMAPEPIKEGLAPDDDVPTAVETRCKVGDLWQLGEHRLLCGDSTNIQHVERLMGGAKADMVFTDPPYGVSYQSNMRTRSDRFEVIANDDVLLTDWVPIVPIVSDGWVFVWSSWKVLDKWLPICAPLGSLTNLIVWDKGGGGIGDLAGTFATDYEVALVFNRGAKLAGKRIGSVWSIGKDQATQYAHPTQKPVELASTALSHCTGPKTRILDLFLGSGSTLIACEKTSRKCYGMEIDTHYCDVILTRWEKFTGKTASRLDEV